MATRRPVLCANCGAHIRKNGYCSSCGLHILVVRKAHNTSNYHYNIGYDKAVARDLSGAIESLNVSLRYNKKNVATRNLLGLLYYEMGEVVTAISHWVMSVNYQSTDNIASKYLKELREDITTLENEDQIAKKYNMALSYVDNEDYDLAIIQLKGALVANPHFVKGYLLLALLYIGQDNYEKARKTLRRVLKIDKANPLAIHYLHEMGDTDENIIHMRMESIDNDGLLDDEYMEEIHIGNESPKKKKEVKPSPIRDIIEKYAAKSVKTGEFGDIKFAKYSGMYVILGLVIGVLLLFFIITPSQKKKLSRENDELIRTYSEELSAKNATIKTLEDELETIRIKEAEATNNANMDSGMPDFSKIENGMSEEDIQNMISNE